MRGKMFGMIVRVPALRQQGFPVATYVGPRPAKTSSYVRASTVDGRYTSFE